MKAGWSNRILLAPVVVGAVALGAAAPAFAQSIFQASQSGVHQAATAQAGKLTIRVEAALPDDRVLLLPDAAACGTTCPGGALSFTINNTSEVPLRVVGVAQTEGSAITSDRSGCAASARFAAPNFATRPWPVIPSNATLRVNGSDGTQLGLGLIHLAIDTPDTCQGATFTIPLYVSAEVAP